MGGFFQLFSSPTESLPCFTFSVQKVGCNFQSTALLKASFWQLDFFFFVVCVVLMFILCFFKLF